MSDELDVMLSEAWNRVSKRLRHDPEEALKRSQRRFKNVLAKPMRESCLVVRSADARISEFNAIIEPYPPAIERHEPHTVTIDSKLVRKLTQPVRIPWPGVTIPEAARMVGRSTCAINRWVRKGILQCDHRCEAGFPGDHRRGADSVLGADALARSREKRRREAIARGEPDPYGGDSIHARIQRAPILGSTGSRVCRLELSDRSKGGRPYVWSHSPIDPGNALGCPPHPVWGTLWQYTWQDFPDDFEMTVERVPRYLSGVAKGRAKRMWGRRASEYEGSEEYKAIGFAGWDFICPGRLDAQIERVPCGRRCRELFLPQPVWTLAKAMGLGLVGEGGLGQSGGELDGESESEGEFDSELGGEPSLVDSEELRVDGGEAVDCEPWRGFEMPRGSGLAGAWFPGVSDPVQAAWGGPRSFACKQCWGVRATCMVNKNGWNDFITHISGGLLYGSDVPRTLAVSAKVRKRRRYRSKKYWQGLGGLEAVARAAVAKEGEKASAKSA